MKSWTIFVHSTYVDYSTYVEYVGPMECFTQKYGGFKTQVSFPLNSLNRIDLNLSTDPFPHRRRDITICQHFFNRHALHMVLQPSTWTGKVLITLQFPFTYVCPPEAFLHSNPSLFWTYYVFQNRSFQNPQFSWISVAKYLHYLPQTPLRQNCRSCPLRISLIIWIRFTFLNIFIRWHELNPSPPSTSFTLPNWLLEIFISRSYLVVFQSLFESQTCL